MDTRCISRKPFLALAAATILLLSTAPSAVAEIKGVDVHGFASQGFLGSTEYNYMTPSINGSWAISEYAVNIGSDLNENLRVGIQFFARTLGDLGNNEVGVDWAFGDYRVNNWLGIRGGRVKMPFGLYNETADFDHVRTSVLMPQGVYDLRMREFRTAINGINPYGYLDLESGGGLEYSVAFGYLTTPRDGAMAKFMNDIPMLSFRSQSNDRTIFAQLIWNTPLEGFRLGHTYDYYLSSIGFELDPMIAAMYGVDPILEFEDNPINIHTSSIEISRGNVTLAGEYNTWKMEVKGENILNLALDWENWYAQGSYRVNQWFEFGTYYSVHYEDKDDREGEAFDPNFMGWQKDLALSLRFDVNPNMIFKLEGHRIDGTASVFKQDNPDLLLDPNSREQNWYMFASKISYVF